MCRRHLLSGMCRLAITEKGQQRTWDYIPKRNCMWEKKTQTSRFLSCIYMVYIDFYMCIYVRLTGKHVLIVLVEMRNTCQVTNQSSHGELSFHHNPHLRLCWGLGLFTSRVVRSGGSRLKNAALPTYCHCCEFCALKQKPGVLLKTHKAASPLKKVRHVSKQKTNPNCRPYSSPHQVPKHRMLWYIEKGTLREVGKIDA